MKVVILAGGAGSRLAEETSTRPKPLVEIGGRPILWHIMKHYARHGFCDFVICLGYKGHLIKQYFSETIEQPDEVVFDFEEGTMTTRRRPVDDWRVTLVDTGLETQTAGRLFRIRRFVGDEPFLMTYGDGVSDVDINEVANFHERHGRLATVTAVRPAVRTGELVLDDDRVQSLGGRQRAPGWINGGFFVLTPGIFDYIDGDVDWAKAPMRRLAEDRQLVGYRHEGYWQCMDTISDKLLLEKQWATGDAPWRTWA